MHENKVNEVEDTGDGMDKDKNEDKDKDKDDDDDERPEQTRSAQHTNDMGN